MTKTQRQLIYLGKSAAPVLRVVFDRVTDVEQGIETGFARYRGSDVAVWRPVNPRCLGLERSWQDGHWRNIYEVEAKVAHWKAGQFFQRNQLDVGGFETRLPLATFRPTPAIQRFVRQHLR